MNLVSEFEANEREYIRQMVLIHVQTKKYLLIAEEVAEQGELFLQPLKEQRDAFDHLMRCYCVDVIDNDMDEESKFTYIDKNLDKAFGHVFRAFFDTADWLTYLLRKWIRTKLVDAGEERCRKEFDDYEKIKKLINDIPLIVAELRNKKDVGKMNSKNESAVSEIEEYVRILDSLIELRKRIIISLGP